MAASTPLRRDQDDGKAKNEQGLNPQEEHQAEELAATRAHIIHEVVRREGDDEMVRSAQGLAWSGLAAGLSMGFSMVGQGLLMAALPAAPWQPLIASLGYTLGFLIVVLARQHLFTENTLTPVVPFLAHPSKSTLVRLLRLWSIVLAANLVGTLIFAWVCARSGVFDPPLLHAFSKLGQESLGGFGEMFVKGVFGGWLIALIPWIISGVQGSGAVVILILTYTVGLGHFTHVIAGSVETLFTVMRGEVGLNQYFLNFLVPVLLGNTVGGVLLVAMVNHAQVVAGNRKNPRNRH